MGRAAFCGLLRLPEAAGPSGRLASAAVEGAAARDRPRGGPAGPLANIVGIRRTMPNSRFVVVRAGLHTNSQFGCVPELIARFVDRGSARSLDISCARSATRPNFAYR